MNLIRTIASEPIDTTGEGWARVWGENTDEESVYYETTTAVSVPLFAHLGQSERTDLPTEWTTERVVEIRLGIADEHLDRGTYDRAGHVVQLGGEERGDIYGPWLQNRGADNTWVVLTATPEPPTDLSDLEGIVADVPLAFAYEWRGTPTRINGVQLCGHGGFRVLYGETESRSR